MMLITYIRWRSDMQLLLSGRYCKYCSKRAGEKEDRISKAGLIDSTEVSLNRNKWGTANTLENPNKCQIKQPLSYKGYVKTYKMYEIILRFHYEYNIHFSSHSLLTTFDTLSRKNVCKQQEMVTWCSYPLKQVTFLNIGTSVEVWPFLLAKQLYQKPLLRPVPKLPSNKRKIYCFLSKNERTGWEWWNFPHFQKRRRRRGQV